MKLQISLRHITRSRWAIYNVIIAGKTHCPTIQWGVWLFVYSRKVINQHHAICAEIKESFFFITLYLGKLNL